MANRSSNGLCRLVLAAALLVGAVTFALFAAGALYIYQGPALFTGTALVGTAGVLFMLLAAVLSKRREVLREAYCCCGNMAVLAGAAAAVLSQLLSMARCPGCSPLAWLGVAALLFFMTLLMGGIWCFLYKYAECGLNRGCADGCDAARGSGR